MDWLSVQSKYSETSVCTVYVELYVCLFDKLPTEQEKKRFFLKFYAFLNLLKFAGILPYCFLPFPTKDLACNHKLAVLP